MRLLLQAALRTKKHAALIFITFGTLILLTIASQLEMFALGVLSNNGSDFFALFSPSASQTGLNQIDGITLDQVQGKWADLDNGQGVITKQTASAYLATHKDANPLNWVLHVIKESFDFSNNILSLIIILMSVAIFKAVWLFASRYTTQLLAIRVSRDLRLQYFEHIQSLPMKFYQQYNIGSLSSRIVGDAGQIAVSINALLTNYLQTPFTVITCLSMCFFLSWQLSLVIFIGAPLIILPITILAKRVKKVSRQLQTNQERVASVLIDFLAGIQTVKIFAMESFSFSKYQEQNNRTAVLESKNAKYGLLIRPILHAITTLCLAIVVLFGLYTIGLSVSQLLVFCGLLQLVYEPIKKFADENSNIQRGVVAAERMFEVLHMKPDIADKPDAVSITSFNDKIEFDHVWFKYQNEWVLKDVSFTIKKGETVAIVGPTGSGKSTIVQLLPRLYEVQKGEIRIDGKPINAYTQKSLRELLAFVSQKPFLFADTVTANISVGRVYSKEAIALAAQRARADEFIERLPQKYDSILAEAGQDLSGGQQQRLAIARALVKNSPLLILDEATSALDAISENHIKTAISSLHREVTQILIAHRLSTIEYADKIIYLEQGVKLSEGTREELMVSCPPFKLMWDTMFRTESKTEIEEPLSLV
ncbi:MAG: ABC transporter ATP-binding protein [Chlamydiae bacterium]|nr:ABC transporter ATP-binding protein [Chlamydiota bacterium]